MFTKTEIELAPKVYGAIKRIAKAKGKKWEWKPEVGEWCIYGNDSNLSLIVFVDIIRKTVILEREWYGEKEVNISECIPFLHWEKLEEIMGELGYELRLDKRGDPPNVAFDAGLGKIGEPIFASQLIQAPTRQEAVMRAIIRLGKEIDVPPEPDLSNWLKPGLSESEPGDYLKE